MLALEVPALSGGSMVNQTSRKRACAGAARDSSTVPLATADVATGCKSASTGRPPARNSRLAPGWSPRESRTAEMVTVRPMSSSRPVPACRCPKSEVAYQSLYQGVAAWPAIANEARCGASPSVVPAGPKAVTWAGLRASATASGLVEGVAVGVAEGLACAVLAWTRGGIDGAGLGRPT